jgi:hypothetical protein
MGGGEGVWFGFDIFKFSTRVSLSKVRKMTKKFLPSGRFIVGPDILGHSLCE